MEGKKFNSECKFDELEDNILSYKCRECGEKWEILIEGLIRKFLSVYRLCKGDLNKFILLLRKGGYLNGDMDKWGKFDESTLPPKEHFYSELN